MGAAGSRKPTNVETPCHQDFKRIMEQPGSLRMLLNLTPGRPMVFQDQPGALLPVSQRLFSTKDRAVAMDALLCGYGGTGSIHHGRVGAGADTDAVGRATGRVVVAGAKKAAKNAKAWGNAVKMYFGRK